ncbi:hypothetical protein F2Q70_00007087, partial [Brassica cretica]
LEGSPVVVAQNDKFDALWRVHQSNRLLQMQSLRLAKCLVNECIVVVFLTYLSNCIEVPFAFRVFPVGAIEATGTQVLDQILRLMLPRFFCLSSPKTIKHGLPETLQGNLLGLARSDSKSKWTLPGSEKSPIFFKCVLVK